MHDILHNTLKLFYSVRRDAVESVTGLYNQVEEKLHTLVMRSNESLQHLEFLFRLREMEAKISTVPITSPSLVLQHRHAENSFKSCNWQGDETFLFFCKKKKKNDTPFLLSAPPTLKPALYYSPSCLPGRDVVQCRRRAETEGLLRNQRYPGVQWKSHTALWAVSRSVQGIAEFFSWSCLEVRKSYPYLAVCVSTPRSRKCLNECAASQ